MRRKVLNSAMRGNTVIITSQRQNQSIDAENVCRGKNFNKEPRAPLNLNQMNHLSHGLNHRRIKWPSADYTQQTMSTLHHRHEWATRGEHTHAPDKSAVGVLDASTYNSNAQRPARSLRRLGWPAQLGPLLAPALLPCRRRQPARRLKI